MIYAIEIFRRPHYLSAKDGRIDTRIPDASAIGADKFLVKESVFVLLGKMKRFSCQGGCVTSCY